jgi:hypothetical protein
MQPTVTIPKVVNLILRNVFAAKLDVPPIRTVMRGMVYATNILLAQIKMGFMLYQKLQENVLVVLQLVELARFVRAITMIVQKLKSVLIIQVMRLFLEQIVCVMMERTVIFAMLGNGVQQ